MFIMLIRKTCPALHRSIINSCKALSQWSLFSLMIWSFSPTSKQVELTLSTDLALNFLTLHEHHGISQAYPSNSCGLVAIPKNVGNDLIKGDKGFNLWASGTLLHRAILLSICCLWYLNLERGL